MQDLIQKLEKATEGGKALNAEIWRLVKPKAAERCKRNAIAFTSRGAPEEVRQRAVSEAQEGRAPDYTTSLDAALSLVPEGMEWETTNLYGIARASVGINADDGPFYGTSEFGSVPVALCIAALRARHSQPSDDKASDLANGAEGV